MATAELRRAHGKTIRDAYRARFADDDARWGIRGPSLPDTMTYGTGLPGDKGAANISVSGNVTGEGKLVIEVNASSSFFDVVKRAEAAISVAGNINSNGPGSTGLSSPDAAAPSPRGNTGYGGHH